MTSASSIASFRFAIALLTLLAVPDSVLAKAHAVPSAALLMKGWIQGKGELRIYRKREDLGRLYDESCVSGVLTRSRTLPKSFNNRFVAIYGSRMSDDQVVDMATQRISIGVENYCGGPEIFIIQRVAVLKPDFGSR